MKLSNLAMLLASVIVLCGASPSKAGDSAEKKSTASLYACHAALLGLYSYPYLAEFGAIDAGGSRIVKDSRTDTASDIIVVPSATPNGYWAYERTGARAFFPVPAKMVGDSRDHYYKLLMGRRAVYINADSRDPLGQPLLQPTASFPNGKSPYVALRAASSPDSQAFDAAVEHDIAANALARSCSHYSRELAFANAETTDELARQDAERAEKGTRSALAACVTVENDRLSASAARKLVECGLHTRRPASAAPAPAREDQVQGGKTIAGQPMGRQAVGEGSSATPL